MSGAAAARLVDHFLRSPGTARFGPYQAEEGEDAELIPQVLIEDHLYRFRMVDADDLDVDLQVFLGIGDLGGVMWEQDVRALLRMAGSGNPTLPEALDGGYLTPEDTLAAGMDVGGAAFLATRRAQRSGSSQAVSRYLLEHPREAVRQFLRLAEGLAELAHIGLAHRNLSPAAIDVDAGMELRLARFEMSALVNDLFRATLDSVSGPARLRELFARDNAEALPYAPPERLAFVLGVEESLVENERSDTYSLAAVVWEWFLGPFPTERLPTRSEGVPDEIEARAVHAGYQAFNGYLRRRLLEDERVPPELANLLARMLAPNPDDRPDADETVALVVANHDRIMAMWDDPAPARPYALLFMPRESAETVYRWGWIDDHPATSDGRNELKGLIREDLRRGFVVFSPNGADEFVDGGERASKRAARYVLLGERGAWFCDLYRPKNDDGVLLAPTPGGVVIKYVAQRALPWVNRRLADLGWRQGRRIPEFELIATDINTATMRRKLSDRPPWTPLLESTTPTTVEAPAEAEYRGALGWLVDYQQAELDLRSYPYIRVTEGSDSEVLVRYDEKRDQRRIVSSPLTVKYANTPGLRPSFGAFFDELENDDGAAEVDLVSDHNGRPAANRDLVQAEVISGQGQDRVLLRRRRGQPPIPAAGWISAKDDRGSRTSLRRQREASYELLRNKTLLGQIRSPRTIRTLETRWADAGRELLGDGPAAVREMLVCHPLSAIQGPPGSGKTRVAAAAIAAYLKDAPAARVLVSAQSNFALDNLAAAVLTEIGAMDRTGRPTRADDGPAPLPLRVVSKAANALDRVDDRILPWTRDAFAHREAGMLHRHALSEAEQAREPLRSVLSDWARALDPQRGESLVPELSDRLHRGANLVFATCATSTPELLAPSMMAVFDWVVVEEAAKAWPTELAIPLVRGLRWSLVGDQAQLPAHRRHDVERFLDSCVNDPHSDIALIGDDRERYLATFDLFANLFTERQQRAHRQRPPLLRMATQFRMAEPIGDLVSRVFYPAQQQPPQAPADGLPAGGLATYLDPDPAKRITAPRFDSPTRLSGRPLLWLDTADLDICRDIPRWSNPGEAAVVVRLLERMHPFPRPNRDGYGRDPIAVLTPYRAQHQLLGRSGIARDYLSTVHAFQGREADVVVVSMVRDTPRGIPRGDQGPGDTHGAIGHLVQRELVNVLFSRARRQLIVVGRFDHYASVMGPDGFWTKVCRAVRLYGTVLSARDLLGGDLTELRVTDDGDDLEEPRLPLPSRGGRAW